LTGIGIPTWIDIGIWNDDNDPDIGAENSLYRYPSYSQNSLSKSFLFLKSTDI